jgi:hypothetical protein
MKIPPTRKVDISLSFRTKNYRDVVLYGDKTEEFEDVL